MNDNTQGSGAPQTAEAEDLELETLLGGGEPAQPPAPDAGQKVALNKVLAQRKQYRDEALAAREVLNDPAKLEAKAAELRAKAQPTPAAQPTPQQMDIRQLHTVMGVIKDLDTDELDFITVYAAGKGKRPEEVVNDAPVKTFIAAHREERRKATATPAPTGRGAPPIKVGGKTVGEMTPAERKASFEERRRMHQAGFGRAGGTSE